MVKIKLLNTCKGCRKNSMICALLLRYLHTKSRIAKKEKEKVIERIFTCAHK